MYCQALDHDLAFQGGGKPRMRLISVRFGNVLASNGSVVPKFKAQIEAGGPVTVTHPDMVRYFMTIRRGLRSGAYGCQPCADASPPDVSVYVLNMGATGQIVELAERMIRLSGLEPGHDIGNRVQRACAGMSAKRDPRSPARTGDRDWRCRIMAASPMSRRCKRCGNGYGRLSRRSGKAIVPHQSRPEGCRSIIGSTPPEGARWRDVVAHDGYRRENLYITRATAKHPPRAVVLDAPAFVVVEANRQRGQDDVSAKTSPTTCETVKPLSGRGADKNANGGVQNGSRLITRRNSVTVASAR